MPQMLLFLLLSIVVPVIPQTEGPKLTLQASTAQPFIGQVVRVDLRITYPGPLPTQPLPLRIPWLSREQIGFKWLLPPQEWVAQNSRFPPTALPLVLGSERIGAVRDGNTNTYLLTWHVLMKEPDQLQPNGLPFGPVSLRDVQGKEVVSNALLLVTRALPIGRDRRGTLWLGVGNFHVEARLEPREIRLGEETLLMLRVKGDGALAAIPAPSLSSLPGWKSAAFHVDPAPDVWEEDKRVRCFCYRIQPRGARRELQLPPIQYSSFDPANGVYVTGSSPMPLLRVRNPQEAGSSTLPTPTPASSLPERLRFFPMEEPGTPRLSWHSPLILFAGAGPLAVIFLIVTGRWFIDRWRWGRATTLAGRWAWRLLHDTTAGPVPARTAAALATYFQLRFGLTTAEPTWEETSTLFRRHGMAESTLEQLRELFQLMDGVRFSPGQQAEEAQLLHATERFLKEMERVTT